MGWRTHEVGKQIQIPLKKPLAAARAAIRVNAGSAGLPGLAVLVLQVGGALAAFQVGAYQALHEAGIESDWVIGTSIGAFNGAIIAGNPPAQWIDRLHAIWKGVQQDSGYRLPAFLAAYCQTMANLNTITR